MYKKGKNVYKNFRKLYVHANIFLDYISLCLEANTRVLGFSININLKKLNPPPKKNRLIGFELHRKQGMIRNLSTNERNMDSAQCS